FDVAGLAFGIVAFGRSRADRLSGRERDRRPGSERREEEEAAPPHGQFAWCFHVGSSARPMHLPGSGHKDFERNSGEVRQFQASSLGQAKSRIKFSRDRNSPAAPFWQCEARAPSPVPVAAAEAAVPAKGGRHSAHVNKSIPLTTQDSAGRG